MMAHDPNPVISPKGAEMNAGPQDSDVMREKEGPSGLAEFSAVMMWGISLVSFMAMWVSIFCRPRIWDSSAIGLKWDFVWYGLFDGLTSVLALFTGIAIWRYRKIGLWLGIIFATLSVRRWMLFIKGAQIWALIAVILWILAIYG